MARSPIPKPLKTTSAHLDYNRQQQDPRSARGLPLRAPHSQFGNGLIEADNEFEYEDGSLRAVWSQVRFGSRCTNESDLRTYIRFSFGRTENIERTASGRTASYPDAYSRAANPLRLIWTRYVLIPNHRGVSERSQCFKTGETKI